MRKPNCTFDILGIKNGEIVTCIVDNKNFFTKNNRIIVNGKRMSLSSYMQIFHPRNSKTNEFQGTKYFTYKGKLISDLYLEMFNFNNKNMETNKLYFLSCDESKILKFFKGNREVNDKHVKDLYKDLKKGCGKYFPPILVDINTMCIADGQHRLTAYQKLWEDDKTEKIKVIFFEYPTNVIEHVIKMNNQQKRWSLNNYAKTNIVSGDESTKLLTKFCKDCTLLFDDKKKEPKYRYATALIFGQNLTNKIKTQNLSLSNDDIDYGYEQYKICEMILSKLKITKLASWVEGFFGAWYDINHDIFCCESLKKVDIETLYEYIDYGNDPNKKRSEWCELFKKAIYEATH